MKTRRIVGNYYETEEERNEQKVKAIENGVNMDLRASITEELDKYKFCPLCYGTGKLKAMQSIVDYKLNSIRGKDTQVKCNHCKGVGLIREGEDN